MHASQKIEASWGTLKQALTFLATGKYQGLGFMLSENDPFCFIDLDHSYDRQNRQITNPKAEAIIRRIDSYTEASPTDGLHILVKAELTGKGIHTPQIEMYDRVRFFTVTTRHIPGTPATIEELYSLLAPVGEPQQEAPFQNTNFLLRGGEGTLSQLPPEAENDPVLRELLAGNISGYPSPSNADFVLILKLLHWSGDDVNLTRRLFLASPLGQRDKIERRTGETTYIDMTIRNALRKRRNPPMKAQFQQSWHEGQDSYI